MSNPVTHHKAKLKPAFKVGDVVRHVRTGAVSKVRWTSKGDTTRAEQLIATEAHTYCNPRGCAIDYEVAE